MGWIARADILILGFHILEVVRFFLFVAWVITPRWAKSHQFSTFNLKISKEWLLAPSILDLKIWISPWWDMCMAVTRTEFTSSTSGRPSRRSSWLLELLLPSTTQRTSALLVSAQLPLDNSLSPNALFWSSPSTLVATPLPAASRLVALPIKSSQTSKSQDFWLLLVRLLCYFFGSPFVWLLTTLHSTRCFNCRCLLFRPSQGSPTYLGGFLRQLASHCFLQHQL